MEEEQAEASSESAGAFGAEQASADSAESPGIMDNLWNGAVSGFNNVVTKTRDTVNPVIDGVVNGVTNGAKDVWKYMTE
jgi:hypothetical protein